MKDVTYYDLAEKIVNIGKIPHGMIGQVLYPKISLEKNVLFLRKVLVYTFCFNTFLYLLAFSFSNVIMNYFGGDAIVLRILFLNVPIIGFSNVLMVLTLLPFGYNKLFTKIIFASFISYIIIISSLYITNTISLYSLTFANVGVEIIVSLLSYFSVKINKILQYE